MEAIIDTPGSELGVHISVSAGIRAHRELGIDIAFVGDPCVIGSILNAENQPSDHYRIIASYEKIDMGENPYQAVQEKPRSSISIAFEELSADRSQCLVSAGHTGATVIHAKNKIGIFPQIQRPALCQMIPMANRRHFLLMDVGASISVTASDLFNFALMGHVAAQYFLGINDPRIGLLNIGSESGKGSKRLQDAEVMLSDAPVNFVGNVEGNSIWFGAADVVLTDGMTGNILLKSCEGFAKLMIQSLLPCLRQSPSHDNASILNHFNPSLYGGAPLLGVQYVCVVAHGQANDSELFNAIKTAQWCYEQKLPQAIFDFLRHVSSCSSIGMA